MTDFDAALDLLDDHVWDPWWDQVSAYGPWMLAVFGLERLFAAQRADARAAWLNLRYIAVAIAVTAALIGVAMRLLQPGLDQLRPALAPLRAALHGWPAWLQFLLHVMLIDFFYYWTHRAQHRYGLLWRLHELHHSDRSFNVTTTLRVHWLEELLKLLTVLVPVMLLADAPAGVPALLAWVGGGWLFFIHANARISFGPLNRLLVSPAVHRVHHSEEPAHHDRNFAAFFSVWDLLFGTYQAPPAGRWPAVGTAQRPPSTAWAAHWRPFRRPRPEAEDSR